MEGGLRSRRWRGRCGWPGGRSLPSAGVLLRRGIGGLRLRGGEAIAGENRAGDRRGRCGRLSGPSLPSVGPSGSCGPRAGNWLLEVKLGGLNAGDRCRRW